VKVTETMPFPAVWRFRDYVRRSNGSPIQSRKPPRRGQWGAERGAGEQVADRELAKRLADVSPTSA